MFRIKYKKRHQSPPFKKKEEEEKTLKNIQAKPQTCIWGFQLIYQASCCVYCLVFLWRRIEISFSSCRVSHQIRLSRRIVCIHMLQEPKLWGLCMPKLSISKLIKQYTLNMCIYWMELCLFFFCFFFSGLIPIKGLEKQS